MDAEGNVLYNDGRSPLGSQYVECMEISLGSGLVGMLSMKGEVQGE